MLFAINCIHLLHDAVENLLSENIAIEKIKNVGNIMIDTLG